MLDLLIELLLDLRELLDAECIQVDYVETSISTCLQETTTTVASNEMYALSLLWFPLPLSAILSNLSTIIIAYSQTSEVKRSAGRLPWRGNSERAEARRTSLVRTDGNRFSYQIENIPTLCWCADQIKHANKVVAASCDRLNSVCVLPVRVQFTQLH